MKFDMNSLLKDKNVLYVTLFIAITNMFAYLMFRQFDAVLFFIIIGIITSHFSKNMIIIMLTAILSTNFAIGIKMIGKVKEGMENKKMDKKKMDNKKMDKKKDMMPKAPPTGMNNPKKTKEKFTQQLNPARVNAMSDDEGSEDDYEDHAKVDYASTLESAYDNLDKLLSSDAINNMSEDTHRLAEKQKMLMGNINKLQPMMEKAGSLLEGLNVGDMNGMLDNLQGKLASIGGGSKKKE